MRRAALLALGFVMAAAVSFGQSSTLDFNAPVPGTLTDANGLGTGFTTRLPGTGTALLINDPNLSLQSGSLFVDSSFTTTPINTSLAITGGAGPASLEAPCVALAGGSDVSVSVTIRNVQLPNISNHCGIFIGTSASQIVLLHAINNAGFQLNEDGVQDQYVGGLSPGDDVELVLVSANGVCSAVWRVLNSGATGTLGPFNVPWIAAAPTLYAGVIAIQQSSTLAAFTAQFDEFSVCAQASTANGQSNSSAARLEINGVGAGTLPGPFVVCTAPLQPLTFAWQGAPLMPMILISGPLRPTPYAVPGIGGLPGLGLVHLGFSPTFTDITIIFDGAHMPGGLQLTTSPTGTASQTVIVPAGTPPGTQIAVQGIVEQVAGTTTYGNLLTAAFRIDVP